MFSDIKHIIHLGLLTVEQFVWGLGGRIRFGNCRMQRVLGGELWHSTSVDESRSLLLEMPH